MTGQRRNRVPIRSARTLGWLVLVLATGCESKPSFVLDSDVPAPQDASGRATTGIKRRGAELIGVETVFAETVDDPQVTLDTLRARFVVGGWTVETAGATGSTATAVFRKADRRCRVRVVRNDLDPAMSRIAYRLDTVAAEADPTNG
jgi:hypothetical protein